MDGRVIRTSVARLILGAWICSLVLVGCSRQPNSPAASSPEAVPVQDLAATKHPAAPNTTPDASSPTDPPTGTPATGTAAADPASANPAVADPVALKAQEGPANPGSSGESSGKADGKEREPLFVGWPQPQLVLLISGQQMGYIEPCGCTGLENQKGGLARRHSLARQMAERGWPVVPIDVGNQIRRFGPQAEIKFQITGDALRKIGYRAVALGADDLRLSVGNLAQTVASDGQNTTPFHSANAAVLDASLTPTRHVVEAGGKRIGVTSVISASWQKKILGSDILLKSPEAGLDEVLPQLRNAKCDILVLLAQASIDESRQLAQKYPDFQVVVTAGGLGEPTFQPETIPGSNAILVQVGVKGMFVSVLGFFDDPQRPWRYQRVPLDARFPDSPEMLEMLASYQEQLQALGLSGLGLQPVPHPTGRTFVGSEKCGECHSQAFTVWKDSKHSHATDSLVHPGERTEIPRHFDPECLSCHVTGWNAQQFFPYETGYLSLEKSVAMHGSGCENCHGPGSAHVAAEEGTGNPTEAILKSLRESVRLPLAQAEQKCKECHDLDNSPDFHSPGAFEKYWKEVEHKGLD